MALKSTEKLALYNRQDALLKKTDALPTADGTSYSTGISLDAINAKGIRPREMELRIEVPDLTTTHLPNSDTLKFSIMSDTVLPIDGSSTVHAADVLSLLGAGGVGTAGIHFVRFSIPTDFPLVIGVRAIAAGGTGDISAIDMTTQLVF